jgi:hypothetical protein
MKSNRQVGCFCAPLEVKRGNEGTAPHTLLSSLLDGGEGAASLLDWFVRWEQETESQIRAGSSEQRKAPCFCLPGIELRFLGR